MFIRFLKRMAIVLALIFAVQGCAFYVEDDGFYHHHHFHHGYRGEGHQQTQVAENRRSDQKSSMDAREK